MRFEVFGVTGLSMPVRTFGVVRSPVPSIFFGVSETFGAVGVSAMRVWFVGRHAGSHWVR